MSKLIYLQHMIFGQDELHKGKRVMETILRDGFLRSSKETGNYKLSGNEDKETVKYIYLKINLRNNEQPNTLVFNRNLLLEQTFWLNYGWQAKPNDKSIKINGTKLTTDELYELLLEYQKNVNKYVKERRKKDGFFMNMMSHEILIKNPINLHNYLEKIQEYALTNEEKQLVKREYPDVSFI